MRTLVICALIGIFFGTVVADHTASQMPTLLFAAGCVVGLFCAIHGANQSWRLKPELGFFNYVSLVVNVGFVIAAIALWSGWPLFLMLSFMVGAMSTMAWA